MESVSSDNNMYKKKLLMLIHSKLHLKSCAFWHLYTNASLPSGCENIIQYKLECSSCENVTQYYTVVLIKLLNQGSFPITTTNNCPLQDFNLTGTIKLYSEVVELILGAYFQERHNIFFMISQLNY